MNIKLVILFSFCIYSFSTYSQKLTRIKHFGKNPGRLKMYIYQPNKLNPTYKKPLVVVLHGCLQTANSVAKQSGWSKLADENGFIVLYPQQRLKNNPERCFNWYRRKNVKKNRGENFSIKQMVDFAKKNYNIDTSQVFITGLSAGAAMSVALMANYPETFNAGAIFAGAPYRVANGMIQGVMSLLGWRIKSPEKWGNIVRKANPNFKGKYPKLIIYQGKNDIIVNKRNGVELMKQWTNINNINQEASECIPCFTNNPDIEKNVYKNKEEKEVVVFYKINKLGHALLVDPGSCFNQGGKTGMFAKDKNYHSTYWTAVDFGLLPTPFIYGKTQLNKNEQNVEFKVPYSNKSKYDWSIPSDCSLIKNDKNIISVNWGIHSGNVNLIETDSTNCKKEYSTINIKIK